VVNKVGTSNGTGDGQWPIVADRYRLGKRLGVGASSEVYAAEDLADRAACAVKLFSAGLEPAAITRLLDEFVQVGQFPLAQKFRWQHGVVTGPLKRFLNQLGDRKPIL